MDFIGVSRTIDHAVYTFLNSLAMVLWKLNTVGFGWSIGSYSMQDWLTGRDNEGVWYLLPRLLGANGMFGVPVWQAVFVLALVLAGATRLLRPFIRVQSSDLGRLLLIGVMSYIFIVQGNQMIRNAEDFRSRAGGLMFELMGQSNVSLDLGVTQVGSGLDRLALPVTWMAGCRFGVGRRWPLRIFWLSRPQTCIKVPRRESSCGNTACMIPTGPSKIRTTATARGAAPG